METIGRVYLNSAGRGERGVLSSISGMPRSRADDVGYAADNIAQCLQEEGSAKGTSLNRPFLKEEYMQHARNQDPVRRPQKTLIEAIASHVT